VDKPKYKIPSMKEIAKVKGTNGYKVVSTFSGAGGSCLGFEMAGYKVVWANEFVEEARNTYVLNHPNVKLSADDIRTVNPMDILSEARLKRGELDVLEGSPPCSSFSTAGKRERLWGKDKAYSDTNQITDDLFFEYVRLLKGLQPKVFVAENVAGLVKGVARGYFLEILQELKDAGYNVKAKVLDSSFLGVPQARQRLIFIGVRNDLGLEPVFPTPKSPRYTMRDAMDVVIRHTNDPETGKDITLDRYALGRKWKLLKEGTKAETPFLLVRSHRDKPIQTITAECGNVPAAGVTHPTQCRKFTLHEVRRLSGFPDDFELTGTFEQRWERLGRSVPPPMMKAIAETIKTEILDKIK